GQKWLEIGISMRFSGSIHRLQNRVPRVQVLLPLPNKADLNTIIFFFDKVIAFVIQLQKLPR
ncbi:MAG: hypothetical protein Q3989_10135, partial [Eubacteriales bacterium]|nr:hypothetical protein [Eubacteriales bacterium]